MTVNKKKMCPGPFENDNVYGPLQLASDVDKVGKAQPS